MIWDAEYRIRFLPRLIVSSKVPTKTFFPLTLTRRQPFSLIILSPLLALLPLIVMLVDFPAIFVSLLSAKKEPHEMHLISKAKLRKAEISSVGCLGSLLLHNSLFTHIEMGSLGA